MSWGEAEQLQDQAIVLQKHLRVQTGMMDNKITIEVYIACGMFHYSHNRCAY